MIDGSFRSKAIAKQVMSLLVDSDIQLIPRQRYQNWPESAVALEDEYSIIGVWQYDTFVELEQHWLSAQDEVLRLVGSSVMSSDPKSWDGYLILVTGDAVSDDEAAAASSIRSNTRRLRKLLITGDDVPIQASSPLELAPSLRRALAPVLDLVLSNSQIAIDPLASISERLQLSKESSSFLDLALQAYKHGRLPMEVVFEARQGKDWTGEAHL